MADPYKVKLHSLFRFPGLIIYTDYKHTVIHLCDTVFIKQDDKKSWKGLFMNKQCFDDRYHKIHITVYVNPLEKQQYSLW